MHHSTDFIITFYVNKNYTLKKFTPLDKLFQVAPHGSNHSDQIDKGRNPLLLSSKQVNFFHVLRIMIFSQNILFQ